MSNETFEKKCNHDKTNTKHKQLRPQSKWVPYPILVKVRENIVFDGIISTSLEDPSVVKKVVHIALLDDFSVIMCHRCATESGGAF